MEEYILDADITELPDFAFYNYTNLTSVTLPKTLESIGESAFEDCTSLTSIVCKATTPPTCGTDAFTNVSTGSCALTVPEESVSTYTATEPWSSFDIQGVEMPEEMTLTDGEAYVNAQESEMESITYTRTLNNLNWNALYVPFEIPVTQLTDNYDVAYINAIHSYDDDDDGSLDRMTMEVVKIKAGTLRANYPYLIRAKSEAAKKLSITVENTTLYAATSTTLDCSSIYTKFEITGTYNSMTSDELTGCYALSSGAWKTLTDDSTLNPFRLYLRISDRDDSPVKTTTFMLTRRSIAIHVRGEEGTTSMEDHFESGEDNSETTIYNLMGQPVKNPQKGHIYIRGGKKVVY